MIAAEQVHLDPATRPAGPLAGVCVVEIGRYIAAPFAARTMADLGAQVIKVEDPDGGDPMRHWEAGARPYSPQFAAYNRGKQGVTIDLREPAGKQQLRDLCRDSDVLLENFRPGVMTRLGLSPQSLLADNPKLIYCSISGFGATGPYSARPSYDTVISAVSGMYSLLIPREAPAPVGPAMSDLLSGMYAVQGILAALHERAHSGAGQIVDVTMLGSVLGFLGEAVTSTAETNQLIEPNTRQRRAQAYGATAGDGKAFIVHLSVPDKFWHALCAAMDRPDWRDDPRLATRHDRYEHYDVLAGLIREQARTRSRDEWFARFVRHDLPHAPLNTLLDVATDEQVVELGLIDRVAMPDGPPISLTASPLHFSRTPARGGGPAPRLGDDNDLLDRGAAR